MTVAFRGELVCIKIKTAKKERTFSLSWAKEKHHYVVSENEEPLIVISDHLTEWEAKDRIKARLDIKEAA